MPYSSSNPKLQEVLDKITDPNSNLTTVSLDNSNISKDDLKLLVDALLEHQNAVTELSLCGNNIDTVGAWELNRFLSRNHQIITLSLGNNKLGPGGIEVLRAPIIKHPVLRDLDISKNSIGREGTAAISKIIEESKELISLNLSKNDFWGGEAYTFTQAIHKNHQKLKSLDLSHNPIGAIAGTRNGITELTIEGKHAIWLDWHCFSGMFQRLGKLTKLNLTSTYIHSNSCVHSIFSSMIPYSSLVELIIQDWALNAAGLKTIFTPNSSLITLSLPSSSITPEVTEILERNRAIAAGKEQIQALLKDERYDEVLTQLDALTRSTQKHQPLLVALSNYIDLTTKHTKEIQRQSIAEHKAKAWALIKANQYESAIAEYEKLKISDKQHAEGYATQIAAWKTILEHQKHARYLVNNSQHESAIAEYEKLKIIDKQHAEEYSTQIAAWKTILEHQKHARDLANNSQYEDAIAEYEKLKELDTDNAEGYSTQIATWKTILEHQKHARDLANNSQYKEAIAEYEKLKELDPEHSEAYSSLIEPISRKHKIAKHKKQALELASASRYNEAINEYKELQKLDTEHAGDYDAQIKDLALAKAQVETIARYQDQIQDLVNQKQYTAAIEKYEGLKVLDAPSAGSYATQIEHLGKILADNKAITERKERIQDLLKENKYAEAVVEYRALKTLDAACTNKYQKQIKKLNKKLAEKHEQTKKIAEHKEQVQDLLDKKQYDEARKKLEKLQELDTEHADKYKAQIEDLKEVKAQIEAIAKHKEQAQILIKQKQYEAAIEKYKALNELDKSTRNYTDQIKHLEKILENDKVIAAHNERIQDLLEENKYAEAIAECKELQKKDPEHTKKYDNRIQKLTEKYDKIKKIAEQIAEYKELAQDLLGKKQYEDAIAKYNELKVIDKQHAKEYDGYIEQARKMHRDAVIVEHKELEVLNTAANSYDAQIKDLELAKAQVETIARYQEEAQDLINANQYDKAMKNYELLKDLDGAEQPSAYDEQMKQLDVCDKTRQLEQMQQLDKVFTEHTPITEIFKLLRAGEGILHHKENEAIIMFGKEGVGKTTLAATLAGDELKAVRGDEGILYITHTTDTGEQRRKIGPEQNKIPTKNQIGEVVIWDSPGFGDTTSSTEEIPYSLYLSRLLRDTEKVKMVLVISAWEFFSPDLDTTTISRFAKLFNNVSDIKESVGLVITGVELDRTIENVQTRLQKIIQNSKISDPNIKSLLEHLHSHTDALNIFYRPTKEGLIGPDNQLTINNFAALQATEIKNKGSFVALLDNPGCSHDEIQISYEVTRNNIEIVSSNIIDSMKIGKDVKPNAVLQLDHEILDAKFLEQWLPSFVQDDDYHGSTAHVHFPALQQLSELINILGDPKQDGLEVSRQVLKSFEDQTSDGHIQKHLASYHHFLTQQEKYLRFFADALEKEGKQVDTQYPMEKLLTSRQESIQENFYRAVKKIEVEPDQNPSYYEEILKWVGETPKPQELSVNAIETDAYYELAHAQPKPVSAEDTQLKLQLFLKAIKHNPNVLQKAYQHIGDLMFALDAPGRALNYYKCHQPSEKIRECFEKMSKNAPEDADMLVARGDYELYIRNPNAVNYYMEALKLLETQGFQARRSQSTASLSSENQHANNTTIEEIVDKINNLSSYNAKFQPTNYAAVSSEQVNDDLQWVTGKLEAKLSGELGGHCE